MNELAKMTIVSLYIYCRKKWAVLNIIHENMYITLPAPIDSLDIFTNSRNEIFNLIDLFCFELDKMAITLTI